MLLTRGPMEPGKASRSSRCLMAALIAPHSLWPSTMTRETPSSTMPYSMLPLTKAPAPPITLPATRTTKRSPTPWSKRISGERPKILRGPARAHRRPLHEPLIAFTQPSKHFIRGGSRGGRPRGPRRGTPREGQPRCEGGPTQQFTAGETCASSAHTMEAAGLADSEDARRPAILAGGHPQDGAVASLARMHGIDGDDVDPLRGQLAEQPRARAHPIIARDEEGPLGSGDLPLGLLGHLAKRRRIGGHEIHLRVPTMRKAGKRDQVDSGLVEHGEGPRPLPRPVGHHHLEVGHALHAIRHERLLLEIFRRS